MLKAVLDTTVLVSAFLRHQPGGASFDLLTLADAGAFEFYLSDEECAEANRLRREIETKNPPKAFELRIVYRDLVPDPEMASSYFED